MWGLARRKDLRLRSLLFYSFVGICIRDEHVAFSAASVQVMYNTAGHSTAEAIHTKSSNRNGCSLASELISEAVFLETVALLSVWSKELTGVCVYFEVCLVCCGGEVLPLKYSFLPKASAKENVCWRVTGVGMQPSVILEMAFETVRRGEALRFWGHLGQDRCLKACWMKLHSVFMRVVRTLRSREIFTYFGRVVHNNGEVLQEFFFSAD